MKVAFPIESLNKVINSEKQNNGAEFTLKSKRTGKEYTFKISKSKFHEKMYTHVYVETGYLNFLRLGHYYNGVILNKKQPVETESSKAISWLLKRLESGKTQELDTLVEVMHLGKCVKCGAVLTDSHSIETGLGPVCASK